MTEARIAIFISLLSFALGLGNFIWTVTRHRRKLSIRATIRPALAADKDVADLVSIDVRNPRKVPIIVQAYGVLGRNEQGSYREQAVVMTRDSDRVVLSEGDEFSRSFALDSAIEKVEKIFVDSPGKRWLTKRIHRRQS